MATTYMFKRIFFVFFLITPSSLVLAQEFDLEFTLAQYPPYSYLVDGQPQGVIYERINQTCLEAKINCKINIKPWARMVHDIESDNTHAVAPMFKTPERLEKYHFMDVAVIQFDMVLLSNEKQLDQVFETKESFKDLKIIKVMNTSTFAPLDQAIEEGLAYGDFVNDIDTQLKMISRGRADYAVGDAVTAEQKISDLNLENQVFIVEPPLESRPAFVVFHKHAPKQLIERFQNALLVVQ